MKKALKIILALFALAALLFLSGCPHFLAPVREFLKEYTENAAIEAQEFLVPVQEDNEGFPSVRSAEAAGIRFLMRNPQRYALTAELAFDDAGISAVAGADYSFTLSQDRQSVELWLSPAFLRGRDPAGDLSGSVTITDPGTGRTFPAYHFKLRSNSPPPRPSGLRIMQVPSARYVACFNLDLSDAIHGDIAGVFVNEAYFPVQALSAGGSPSITFQSADAGTVAPAGLSVLPGGSAFVPDDPAQLQVYILTAESVTDALREFTVRVVDTKGLESSAAASSKGARLGLVQMYDAQGTLLPSGATLLTRPEDGLAGLEARAAATDANGDPVSGVEVHYEVLRSSTLYASGSGVGTSSLSLVKSPSYTIRAWATKPGYLDSDLITLPFAVKGVHLFIHPSAGDDASGDGSLLNPYKTITQTFTDHVPANDGDVYVMYLMANISEKEVSAMGTDMVSLDTATSGFRTLILDGRGYSIHGNDTYRCLGSYEPNLDLTIKNITLENGSVNGSGNGAGISFSGGNKLSITEGSRIIDNVIAGAGGQSGGGLYFNGTELNIRDSFIERNAIYTSGEAYGGGVCFMGTKLIVHNSHICDNVIGRVGEYAGRSLGGGIRILPAAGSEIVISDSSIERNRIRSALTVASGGGVHIRMDTGGGIVDVRNTSISYNEIYYTATDFWARGGGITISGNFSTTLYEVDVNQNSIESEVVGQGGGAYFDSTTGTTTIIGCDISQNSVRANGVGASPNAYGGGMYADGGTYAIGSAAIGAPQTIISGNSASGTIGSYGGGICILSGTHVIQGKTTIYDNQALPSESTSRGGGIMAFNGTLTLDGVYVLNNSAERGSGGYVNDTVTFTIQGSTVFDSMNDVFLPTNGRIAIFKELTPLIGFPRLTARITPSQYIDNVPILIGDVNDEFPNNYKCFSVTPNGSAEWVIDKDGRLQLK